MELPLSLSVISVSALLLCITLLPLLLIIISLIRSGDGDDQQHPSTRKQQPCQRLQEEQAWR
jgi:hypothetical protein